MAEPQSQQTDSELTPKQLQQLTAFSRHLSSDAQAAARVKASENPSQIVAIAAELGFSISLDALRSRLWDLQADHWPWAGESGRWRIRFFRQTAI